MKDIDPRVDDLLVDWEAARLEGRELSATELCADTPELVDELSQKIAVLKDFAWVSDPDQLVAQESTEPAALIDETCLPDTDVTVEEFVHALSHSGAFGAAALSKVHEFVPADAQQRAWGLAKRLVEKDLITSYQARVVLERGESPLLLDRYIILDSIGAGGMGIVFKALQQSLERIVAVKVLPKHAVDSPEKVERFQREMRAAARISHPNVVQAFDAHESNGVYFFAMEYVDGDDLAQLVENYGKLPVDQAVEIVAQAAAGLASAHANGVVHRDVKPSNILLANDGTAKVLDLGLARTRELVQTSAPNELTRDGLTMGTVTYMSPEQAFDARQADIPSDVYSLGCTLYFLLHGKPLFDRPNSVQIVLAHREIPPPRLSDGCAEVPDALETLFQQMVCKDPNDRPPSMEVVRSGLLAVLAGEDLPQAQSATERPGRRQSLAQSSSETETVAASNVAHEANAKPPEELRSVEELAPAEPEPISMAPNARAPKSVAVVTEQRSFFKKWGVIGVAAIGLLAIVVTFNAVGMFSGDGRSETARVASELINEKELSLLVDDVEGQYILSAGDDIPALPFEIVGALLWIEQIDQLPEVRKACPRLTRLDISSSDLNGQPEALEIADAKLLDGLSELSFTQCRFDEELVSYIGSLKSLKSLEVTDCEGPLDGFAALTELEVLDVLESAVTDGDLVWLGSLRQLEELDLSNNQVTCKVLQNFRGHADLEVLTLTGVEISEDLQLVQSLPNLKELVLSATDLDDDQASWLEQMPQLELLDVSHTKLTSRGIANLAKLRKLNDLALDGLAVKDSFSQILGLPDLEYLSLENTDVDDACLEQLSKRPGLTWLALANTKVTVAAVERLQLRMPSCRIETEPQQDWVFEEVRAPSKEGSE